MITELPLTLNARHALALRTIKAKRLELAQAFVRQAQAARCPDYYQYNATRRSERQRRTEAFWRQLSKETEA